jgi:predicted phosphoribosyltransferase
MIFRDRSEAGRLLAFRLAEFVNREDVTVLGLPRGGVPVAFEVAQALHAPLDVFVVRKLGTPGQEELAMGAIASGGVRVLNTDVISALEIPPETVEAEARAEERELERREQEFRGNRAPIEVRDRTVILVDDGLATGSTMKAAVAALRAKEPRRIVVAVPVAARSTCEEMQALADAVVCLHAPAEFFAVGQWYRTFPQTSDDEVRALLARATSNEAQATSSKPQVPGHKPED